MSVNSGLKATTIIGQRKVFYRNRSPESSRARKETVAIGILVTSTNGHRKIMQSIKIMSRPTKKGSGTSWAIFEEHLPKKYQKKGLKLATFRRSAKGSRKAASEGPKILYIWYCSLSSNSLKQLGAPAQTWQQYSIHGRFYRDTKQLQEKETS